MDGEQRKTSIYWNLSCLTSAETIFDEDLMTAAQKNPVGNKKGKRLVDAIHTARKTLQG